jgi:hypothetical protein
VKTIAISIDIDTLRSLERIATASPRDPSSRRRRPNRSEIVRLALAEFVDRRDRRDREEADREALARDRARLRREEKALVAEQADL